MFKRIWKWFWAPTSRFGWGAILGAGVVAGIVLWGGFNTFVEYTNTMEFCVSCHEMAQLVYPEYQKTIHYTNRTGVRVICSDCHVPKDWGGKIVRKVKASNELFHKIAGSINTKEKFEAKRLELAENVWAQLDATNSQECRNCHAFEAMDFHKQSKYGARAMKRAMKKGLKGENCIRCHKGVAHKLPDEYEE